MLRVTVELVPGGFEPRAETIGTVLIVNDGTGTADRGNYNAHAYRRRKRLVTARDFRRGVQTRSARVENHARSKPIWTLVRTALTELGY